MTVAAGAGRWATASTTAGRRRPLIVSYRQSRLLVEDVNHRIEGLRRAGRCDHWEMVGFDDDDQRQAFLARTGHGVNRIFTAPSRLAWNIA